MIKGTIDKGTVRVSIHGDVDTLAAEVCCLIRSMFRSIGEEDKKSADRFKEIIVGEANGDEMFNPNFDDSVLLKGDSDSNDKLLELLKGLKGLLEDED